MATVSVAAGKLRTALEAGNWKRDFLQKSAKLRDKVQQAQKDGNKLSKGAGGNVSSVIKARMRLERVADLLRAMLAPCGAALVHGSVALTAFCESQKYPLQLLLKDNNVQKYNVQNHPWVYMDHNSTVQAYHSLRELQCQLFVERAMQRAYEGYFQNKKQQREAVDEFRTRLRARMRRETLTTLRVHFKDSKKAIEQFGSDEIVLSAIVYRRLPEDVESQITPAGMTTRRIIEICEEGMEKHEALYASQQGQMIPRCIRTLPSNLTFNYFDQETYFWNDILPRIQQCVERGLSGTNAVRHVFDIADEDDGNQCQRAFGHWLLVELKSTFGAKFSDQYKKLVRRLLATRCEDEGVNDVFQSALDDVQNILKDFEETHQDFKQTSSSKTADNQTRKTYDFDDRTPAFDLLNKNEKHTRLQVLATEKRKRKIAELDAAQTSNEEERLLSENTRGYKYARSESLPRANASWWRNPWHSNIAQAPPSNAYVPAAFELGESRTGAFAALSAACLRRTPMEIEVGAHVQETATNATNPMRAAERRAERTTKTGSGAASKVNAREMGVDARRTIAAQQDKPTRMRDYIQHTDGKGKLSVSYSRKKRSNFLVGEFEDESIPHNLSKLRFENPAHALRLFVAYRNLPTQFAYKIKHALRQSRTPTRMESETNDAIFTSPRMHKVACELGRDAVLLYVRLLRGSRTL